MMEKSKRDFRREARSSRGLALVLILIGVLFLLINAQVFSFSDIGAFFGSIGHFFGSLGSAIGHFFGSLGSTIGRIFGSLGSSIGRWWPVLLIAFGLLLLVRRGKPTLDE